MVRNITDVDDSILPKARELGIPYLELAEAEIARFRSRHGRARHAAADRGAASDRDDRRDRVDRRAAARLRPRVPHPRHRVLRRVDAPSASAALSHYPREQMVRLARARGGNPDDPHRRDPLDFVLWQPSLADEPAWRAPFGVGRPGWHIECSAMSMQELGPTLDLHGGGTDLIFPHHECEVAQSEALTGKPFVRHWLHSAMVAYEGEKMSKSLGNLVFISDLLKVADPRAIRLALMHHHYRSGFEWHDTDIQDGNALLHRLVAAAQRTSGPDPTPYAQPGAGRDRQRPRRPARRSRRSASSPTRSSRAVRTRPRRTCSGSSAPCSASTSRCPVSQLRGPGAEQWQARQGPPVTSLDHERRWERHDHAAGRLREGAADGLDRRRRRRVDRQGPGQGCGGGDRRRRPRWTSARPIDHDATVAIITANSDEGREVLRHSTSHLMAQAVFDLFPGAKYAIGPAIADGFYYDFELPDGQHFTDSDLERIEARMREIVAEDEPFVREEYDFDRGLELFADQPYKQEIIRNVSARCRGRRGRGRGRPATARSASTRTSTPDGTRRVRRPVPRSARAVDRQARRVQADEGRRRVLAGRREAPDAPADLRHRVGERQGAEGVPAPARGGRAARPPQARRRARPVLVPRRDRLRARGLPPEGRHGPPDHGGVLARSATSRRATTFVNSPHITKAALFEESGHLDWYADGHVPADGAGRGHGLLPQADELPVPHPDLPEPDAVVPRPAAAATSSSGRCTATRSPASCTASPACGA